MMFLIMIINNMKKIALLFIAISIHSPTNAQVTVTNGLSHIVSINLGDEYNGIINLTNTGNTKTKITLEQYDLQTDSTGHFNFIGPNQIPRSNAEWITFYPTQLEIKAGAEAIIHFRIKAPTEQNSGLWSTFSLEELIGSYWSLVVVKTGPLSEMIPDKANRHSEINTVVQYGIQIITNIGQTGLRNLDILQANLITGETDRNLLVEIKNSGQLLLRPEVRVEIYEQGGSQIKTFKSRKKRIYPNGVRKDKYSINNIPPGKYNALVIADCGGEDVYGRQFALSVEE
jgi:hypothetical protein